MHFLTLLVFAAPDSFFSVAALAILVPRAASLGMLLEAARATGVQATEFDNVLDPEKVASGSLTSKLKSTRETHSGERRALQ